MNSKPPVTTKTTLQDRANIAKINAQLCRRFWAGEKISYKDDYYDFKDVELKPTPSKTDSDLVRRRHAGFGAPRGGLLRRLDARTHSHGDVQ